MNDVSSKPFDIQRPQTTPDITLSGAAIDRMMMHLNSPVALVKGMDNMMHPLVDPNFIISILVEALRSKSN